MDGRALWIRHARVLPDGAAARAAWSLRATDVDLHGHVNNAVYWQAVEDALPAHGVDPAKPLVAELDFRDPIDLADPVELAVEPREDGLGLGFYVDDTARAVARVSSFAR